MATVGKEKKSPSSSVLFAEYEKLKAQLDSLNSEYRIAHEYVTRGFDEESTMTKIKQQKIDQEIKDVTTEIGRLEQCIADADEVAQLRMSQENRATAKSQYLVSLLDVQKNALQELQKKQVNLITEDSLKEKKQAAEDKVKSLTPIIEKLEKERSEKKQQAYHRTCIERRVLFEDQNREKYREYAAKYGIKLDFPDDDAELFSKCNKHRYEHILENGLVYSACKKYTVSRFCTPDCKGWRFGDEVCMCVHCYCSFEKKNYDWTDSIVFNIFCEVPCETFTVKSVKNRFCEFTVEFSSVPVIIRNS
jgi:hypothetical protein